MTSRWRGRRLVVVACVCCLISLATMNWAMIDPRPLVVMGAMSAGQGIGIFGVFLYLVAVLRDLKPRLARESAPPPPPASTPKTKTDDASEPSSTPDAA